MIPVTLAFLAGILLVQQWPHLPPLPWLLPGVAATLLRMNENVVRIAS